MPKSERGIALLVVLFFVFSIAVSAVLGYKFGKNPKFVETPKNAPTPSASVEVVVSGNRQIDSSTLPEINTLYFGENEGEDALFVTSPSLQKFFEGGIEKTSPTIGMLRTQTSGESPYDFKNLVKPKKLITIKGDVDLINNFLLSADGKTMFVSLMLRTASTVPYPQNVNNVIFKINLDNSSGEEIWRYDLSQGKYGTARGATLIEKVASDNNFIVLNLMECYGCEPTLAGQIILNTETEKEKYFDDIGNVLFQLNEGKFTYQKLEPQEESCGAGPGCDNGKRTVYKPSGETFAEDLP